MSILKGILHHWNKTSSAYDTIHPETEVAQVTDWNKGIVNTLASTGLSSLVNVLSSDSLLALLIKKYLMQQVLNTRWEKTDMCAGVPSLAE